MIIYLVFFILHSLLASFVSKVEAAPLAHELQKRSNVQCVPISALWQPPDYLDCLQAIHYINWRGARGDNEILSFGHSSGADVSFHYLEWDHGTSGLLLLIASQWYNS